jgi:hypothetical protein
MLLVDGDQHLVIGISSFLEQRRQARLDQPQLRRRRHDDADLGRVLRQAIVDGVEVCQCPSHLAINPAALEMVQDGAGSSLPGIGLAVTRRGGRFRNRSPMIQDVRYVAYPIGRGPLRAAQDQVVVLRAIEADTEAADAFDQGATIHPQVIIKVLT